MVSALVTDMNVDPSVLKAMNEINASRRQREAAVERAEAEKILCVKAAEAEAEAKELSGRGTARMRQAITEGFKGSIESMRESCVPELPPLLLQDSRVPVFAVQGRVLVGARSQVSP